VQWDVEARCYRFLQSRVGKYYLGYAWVGPAYGSDWSALTETEGDNPDKLDVDVYTDSL
jgi:hypothetical protein